MIPKWPGRQPKSLCLLPCLPDRRGFLIEAEPVSLHQRKLVKHGIECPALSFNVVVLAVKAVDKGDLLLNLKLEQLDTPVGSSDLL